MIMYKIDSVEQMAKIPIGLLDTLKIQKANKSLASTVRGFLFKVRSFEIR